MKPYRRRVQYYETDMMGITHHARYIHWMEEARIDFMDQLGFPYREMEARDIFSPVKSIACDYRRSCTFGDEIAVTVRPESFNGVVLRLAYDMVNTADGETVCTAASEHCFLNREGRFVRLKRALPEFAARMEALCAGEGADDGQ